MMGEEDAKANDPNQYISVELIQSQAIVNIKRKRLMLKGLYDKIHDNTSSKKRSRSIS